MDPLILKPIYKEKKWGSNKLLEQVKNKSQIGNIGEIWEVALDETNISSFENFEMNMKDIFTNTKLCRAVLGNRYINCKKFPLIIKTLLVNGETSIQVHPDNKFAKKNENALGKYETWYVLYANQNAYVNIGLNSRLKKKQLEEALRTNRIMFYLKRTKIKEGDIINIPSGTIHSIVGKAILYEVQQNSNITYRLYDSGKRKLEIEKGINAFKNHKVKVRNKSTGILTKNRYYKIKKIKIARKKKFKTYGKFEIITIIKGTGQIISKQTINLNKGMTLLIPASVSSYIIAGNIEIIITSKTI